MHSEVQVVVNVLRVRFLTVADKTKSDFYEWWLFCGLVALKSIQSRGCYVKKLRIPILHFRFGGDHAELLRLCKGLGGKHRTAFCPIDIDDRLNFMIKTIPNVGNFRAERKKKNFSLEKARFSIIVTKCSDLGSFFSGKFKG